MIDYLQIAEIAQLVERNLAKVEVAGPSPVFRSRKSATYRNEVADFLFAQGENSWNPASYTKTIPKTIPVRESAENNGQLFSDWMVSS